MMAGRGHAVNASGWLAGYGSHRAKVASLGEMIAACHSYAYSSAVTARRAVQALMAVGNPA